MKHSYELPDQRAPDFDAERLAAQWNLTDGVRRYGLAYGLFAEAVGHLAVIRDPRLFDRSLVGTWETMRSFVDSFVTETGMEEQLGGVLPQRLRPFATIDRAAVADDLRRELLVLTTDDDRVWVFDAPRVVDSTVHKTEQEAHTEEQMVGDT